MDSCVRNGKQFQNDGYTRLQRDWGAVMAVALVGAGVCAVSVGLSAAVMNLTKAIRSLAHLIGFHLANIICSFVFGLYLAYLFLRPRNFIEPGAAPKDV